MAYGHAERNLAAIWLLAACTEELLGSLARPGSGQSCWLQQAAEVSSQCPGRASAWPIGPWLGRRLAR
jgi:hypothetical protein